MFRIRSRTAFALSAAVALGGLFPPAAFASERITYQGQLAQNGSPVNGTRDMTFSLWNAEASGTQLSPTWLYPNVPVDDGLFQVEIDFTGEQLGATHFNRWLEITVEGNTLSPRQKLTASPYSLQTRGIFVQDDGDVGMGTTAPLRDLHIKDVVPAGAGQPPAELSLEWEVAGIGSTPHHWLTLRAGGTDLPAEDEGIHIIKDSQSPLHLSTQNFFGGAFFPQFTLDVGGDFGIRENDPLARVHVEQVSLFPSPGLVSANLFGEDILLDSDNAVLGLYSRNTGSRGSAIVMGEVNGGVLADKWTIGRNATGSDSVFYIKYGFNQDHNANATKMIVRTNGDLDMTGRVLAGPSDVATAHAYGHVESNGSISTSSSNVLSVTPDGNGTYDISIAGGFNPATDVVVVSAVGSDDVACVSNNGNLLRVNTIDLTNLVDRVIEGGFFNPRTPVPFHFAIYRP